MDFPSQIRIELIPIKLHFLALLLFQAFVTLGCGRGYIVDDREGKVSWQTWDESNGTRQIDIKGADADTFEILEIGASDDYFARDKNHVYRRGRIIQGADPATFRLFNFTNGYRDDKSVFMLIDGQVKRLKDSDPDSFKTLSNYWSRDDTRMFHMDRGFIPHDIDSFEFVTSYWARDAHSFYY